MGRGDKTAEWKDMSSSLLTETPKSQLTAEQTSPITAGTYPKDTLHRKTKRKPQQDGSRDTIKSNPIHPG